MPASSPRHTVATDSVAIDEQPRVRGIEPLGEQNLFKALIDDAFVGILIHQNHSPLYVNAVWARLHGYHVEDILSMHTVLPLIHPADQDRILHHYLTRLAGRESAAQFEYEIKHKHNHPVRVTERSVSVLWEGKPATLSAISKLAAESEYEQSLISAHRDIEDEVDLRTAQYQQVNNVLLAELEAHRHASEHLVNNEERFREFAKIAADWLWETDAELRFSYVSSPMEAFFAATDQAIIGSHYKDIVYAGMTDFEARDTHLGSLNLRRSFDVNYELMDANGKKRVIAVHAQSLYDDEGHFTGYRGIGRDISNEQATAEQLVWQATHDDVTGLLNRREFERVLTSASVKCLMNNRPLTLCYIDLDQFKRVNDTAGHAAGDQLLRDVAACIETERKDTMTLARIRADEFGLLLEGCEAEAAKKIAGDIISKIDALRFAWDNRPFAVSASIGITQIAAHNTITDILARADAACFTAKEFGRGRVHVYHENSDEVVELNSTIGQASVIRKALEDERFELYVQPIVPLHKVADALQRYEVLVRLRNRQGGIVTPAHFIPPAERFGLIRRIDHWVIKESLRVLAKVERPETTLNLAVNISAHTLAADEFASQVETYFDEFGVDPCCICFELTETTVIQRRESALNFVMRMRHLGCRFALDDFGSGLSSFSYLREFPIDNIKIDGRFVKNSLHDRADRSIVEAIVHIARAMGIQTTAEWVERDNLVTTLRAIGVEFGQGFALGIPRPIAESIKFKP